MRCRSDGPGGRSGRGKCRIQSEIVQSVFNRQGLRPHGDWTSDLRGRKGVLVIQSGDAGDVSGWERANATNKVLSVGPTIVDG